MRETIRRKLEVSLFILILLICLRRYFPCMINFVFIMIFSLSSLIFIVQGKQEMEGRDSVLVK